jgi:hypothetical protein
MEVQNNGIQVTGYDYTLKKMAKKKNCIYSYFSKLKKSGCFPFNYGGLWFVILNGNKMWIKNGGQLTRRKPILLHGLEIL